MRPSRNTLAPGVDGLEPRRLLSIGVRSARVNSPAIFNDIVYTNDSADVKRLDIRLPADKAPPEGFPVVLAIHGGGWRRFSKAQYAPKVVRTLRSAGFAVVAPDYSLSTPGRPGWPDNVDDLLAAVQWVKSNAATYGLDASRIAAMGESAGGHLAAMLGTDPSVELDAVIDFFGPTDLAALYQFGGEAKAAVAQYLGASPSERAATYAEASPVHRVSMHSAPTLILHGTADSIVPVEQSRLFAKALEIAGVPNKLILLRGYKHGFGFAIGRRVVQPVLDFLRDHLKTSRDAPVAGSASTLLSN